MKLWFRASRYPDKTLGQRIRKHRLEKGFKQIDLAKRLKVDEATIINWEKDRTIPTNRYRDRLKKFLDVHL
nr:helix-turn-helix domain-containing protein [Candidatus Omnitrophota bacterium]